MNQSRSDSQRSSQRTTDPMVDTPIDIARARYASTYGESVVNRPDETAVSPGSKARPRKKSGKKGSAISLDLLPSGSNGCMLMSIIGLAFVFGGLLGGVAGGSMLLWLAAENPEATTVVAFATLTPVATPTPAPVETVAPTATPVPQPQATAGIEDIIADVIPSVVTVINQQKNVFVPVSGQDEGRVVGSGVIVDSRGYIATNNHVVDIPGELNVVLFDGRQLAAELIATNPAEDLAILKIATTDLKPIKWGDSSKARPGQIVYAIGSPLGDFPNSVSFGIISGLNRALEIDKFVIDGLIQTDAAINRGSSGGPLINLQGEVLGINTFIIRESEERGIAEGIAFSIPADSAKNLLIPWIAAHTGESVPIPASEDNNAIN